MVVFNDWITGQQHLVRLSSSCEQPQKSLARLQILSSESVRLINIELLYSSFIHSERPSENIKTPGASLQISGRET